MDIRIASEAEVEAYAVDWHKQRRQRILRDHPEVRALFGPTHVTAWFVGGLVLLQFAIAYVVSQAAWGWVILSAYLVGATVSHGLGALIHDCAHNLAFRGSAANKALAMLANVPLILPAAIDFRNKHLLHHTHLGQGPARDTQAPSESDVEWIGGSAVRKFWWLTLGTLRFEKRNGSPEPIDPWVVANIVVQVIVVGLIVVGLGLHALTYLTLSGFFAFSIHPSGIRKYGEHLVVARGQPTNSYYGPLDLLNFHVGHHVEHHDFPGVPWNRLPELRRLGGHHYSSLYAFRSWTGLLVGFLTRADLTMARYANDQTMSKALPSSPRPNG